MYVINLCVVGNVNSALENVRTSRVTFPTKAIRHNKGEAGLESWN